MQPFHLAIPVKDLTVTKNFYSETLGCKIGRTANTWVDFDFFGHQLTIHLKPEATANNNSNKVDGKNVPIPHFGVVLIWDEWQKLSERLKKTDLEFIIAPHIRFQGQIGEQATMFFYDPSGNAIEFKSFQDISQLFAF